MEFLSRQVPLSAVRRLPIGIEEVALAASRTQHQCFAALTGQIPAYTHGQRLDGGSRCVGVDVAPQAFADLGRAGQLAIALVGQLPMLGTKASLAVSPALRCASAKRRSTDGLAASKVLAASR